MFRPRDKSSQPPVDGLIGEDAEVRGLVAEAELNTEVSQLIFDLSTHAEMTQQQLADLIGTSQSVIAKLEDAEYKGHSLSMLVSIGAARDYKLEIHFVPKKIAA